MADEWNWYYARHEEGPYQGPYGSRDEAITEGRGDLCDGDAFWITKATNPPVKLSEWIEADRALELADERIMDSDRCASEFDETIFGATQEQQDDLTARLKRACDEWQAAHGLTFHANTFDKMAATEAIPEQVEEAEEE